MEIDHLIREVLGGHSEEQNLWLAYSACNEAKGSRIMAPDLASGEMVRLFDPRHQCWNEHFAWSKEGDLIIGLDDKAVRNIDDLSPSD